MNPWQLKQAARVIHGGGVIAYPTEAVYGLGCDPFNHAAVSRLMALKQRSMAKGLILVAADMTQLTPFIQPLDSDTQEKLDSTWPGPVTWLLPARPETPVWLRGAHDTIAVRVTDHPLAAALCRAAGHALVSTSANLSGRPPARSPLAVRRHFHQELAFVLHGPLGGQSRPTEIRELKTGHTFRKA